MSQNLRNRIASVSMDIKGCPDFMTDNLAIAICSYWEGHMDRPDDDKDDDEGWSPWVRQQYEETMDRIVSAVEGKQT